MIELARNFSFHFSTETSCLIRLSSCVVIRLASYVICGILSIISIRLLLCYILLFTILFYLCTITKKNVLITVISCFFLLKIDV